MNSYKCSQCGLVNWMTQEFCKRCGIPNPHSSQSFQPVGFAPQAPQNNFYAQSMMAQPAMMPDYASPPPPNVFGASVGSASAEGFNNFAQPPFASNRPPIRAFNQPALSPQNIEELKKAEKQIKNAWVCGAIVCAITVLVAVLMLAMASSTDIIPATPVELLISVVIFGGLTLGVYFKSRACAVLLCGLFILDKIITMASTGKLSGALLTFIFIYYFAYGIQGTFTYHKLTKQK